MALNASQLGSELETAVRTSQGLDGTPYPQLTAYCNAIAQAIIDHFVANAEISNGQLASDLVVRTPSDSGTYAVDDVEVTGGII